MKMKTKKNGKKPATDSSPGNTLIADLLRAHFGQIVPEELTISERQFPYRVRTDLQKAVDQVINSGEEVIRFCGVRQPYGHEGIEFSGLMVHNEHTPPVAVPPQYEEIDAGEEEPVRCLKIGLWLIEKDGYRHAVLLS